MPVQLLKLTCTSHSSASGHFETHNLYTYTDELQPLYTNSSHNTFEVIHLKFPGGYYKGTNCLFMEQNVQMFTLSGLRDRRDFDVTSPAAEKSRSASEEVAYTAKLRLATIANIG